MPSSKGQFRIELTPEQKAQVRNATGKDAEAVELSVEELEERIAGGGGGGGRFPLRSRRGSKAIDTARTRPRIEAETKKAPQSEGQGRGGCRSRRGAGGAHRSE